MVLSLSTWTSHCYPESVCLCWSWSLYSFFWSTEWHKHDVNDKSKKVKGGLQRIQTIDGYIHPINIVNGLAYTRLRLFTDEEWDTLPHVIWTEDTDWDPRVIDCSLDDDEYWFDSCTKLSPNDHPFTEIGDSCHRLIVQDAAIEPAHHFVVADILSKHWDYWRVWTMLQALLFYQGNTMDLVDDKSVSHGLQAYGE